jgi:NO-binding membrane sensor protein with MHYT domain
MYTEQCDTGFQGVSVGKACGRGESVAMLHHTGMAAIETFGQMQQHVQGTYHG